MEKTLKKEKYEGMLLYSFQKENLQLLKKIIESNFITLKEYKNDSKTYVAKVRIGTEEYILKRLYPRNKKKKFLSMFRKSESLSSLKTIEKMRKEGLRGLLPYLGSAEKRKYGMVEEEILIMEFCSGKRPELQIEFMKVLETLDEIYKKGRFHGDCNINNFIIEKNSGEAKIIDTKLKRMFFGDYRKHYDFLVLQKYLPQKIEYPYSKNIYYYLAKLTRRIRDIRNQLKD